jgi:hypothetical protein
LVVVVVLVAEEEEDTWTVHVPAVVASMTVERVTVIAVILCGGTKECVVVKVKFRSYNRSLLDHLLTAKELVVIYNDAVPLYFAAAAGTLSREIVVGSIPRNIPIRGWL